MTTEQRDKLTKEIDRSVLEMVDELNDSELEMLHDFIVNYCDNTEHVDENNDLPNLFRICGIVSPESNLE